MVTQQQTQGATARAQAFAQDLIAILARLPDHADRRSIDAVVSAHLPQEEHTNILEGSLCEHVLQNHNHTRTKAGAIAAVNAYLRTNIIDARAAAVDAVNTNSNSNTRWYTPALMHKIEMEIETILFGAEEVAMNGACVAARGAGVAASFARQAGIKVVVVAQAAKFTDSTLLNYSTQLGLDILHPEEIDVIATEFGLFQPHQAPKVLNLMRKSLNQQ